MLPYNNNLKEYSRQLRKNMIDAERVIWSNIRGKQLKSYQFYRQKIIGDYIADYYCAKAQLVIELDGGQHYSDEGERKDRVRDNYMRSLDLRVLRFSDRDVFKNLDAVMAKIWRCL